MRRNSLACKSLNLLLGIWIWIRLPFAALGESNNVYYAEACTNSWLLGRNQPQTLWLKIFQGWPKQQPIIIRNMGSTSLRNDENSSEMSFVFNLMHTGSSTSSRAPCIRLPRNLPNIISFYFLSQGSHWINNQLSFCPSTRMPLYIVPFKKYYTITSFVTISINNFSAVNCPDIYI